VYKRQVPEAEAGVVAALTGKSLALKVIGNVNASTGKGYPSLPYSGFARLAGDIGELSFSNNEETKIAETLAAQSAQRASGGSAEGSGSISAPVAALDPDQKF
jgi:hypothetical protein